MSWEKNIRGFRNLILAGALSLVLVNGFGSERKIEYVETQNNEELRQEYSENFLVVKNHGSKTHGMLQHAIRIMVFDQPENSTSKLCAHTTRHRRVEFSGFK